MRKRLSWFGLRYYKDDELGVSNETNTTYVKCDNTSSSSYVFRRFQSYVRVDSKPSILLYSLLHGTPYI